MNNGSVIVYLIIAYTMKRREVKRYGDIKNDTEINRWDK
jgi:hypothetical protein